MSSVKTTPSVKDLIAEMGQLSQEDQRSLANAVLNERTLEAFVEELEDQLSCERAVTEGGPEQFTP
ncbi:MAG TPA: hypothetical protein VFD62_08635 [Pyrinomonadaceae bacterium]|nr:hypothetical protein [Pyrinomonadaceae bacterium]